MKCHQLVTVVTPTGLTRSLRLQFNRLLLELIKFLQQFSASSKSRRAESTILISKSVFITAAGTKLKVKVETLRVSIVSILTFSPDFFKTVNRVLQI